MPHARQSLGAPGLLRAASGRKPLSRYRSALSAASELGRPQSAIVPTQRAHMEKKIAALTASSALFAGSQ